MPLVEKRYAEALVDIAVGTGKIDEFQQELLSLGAVFGQQNEIRSFFLNPEINIETKKNIIKNSFNGKLRNDLIGFLLLLLEKRRMEFLPGIISEFILMTDKIKSTINMTIISAAELSEEQISEIRNKYVSVHKASAVKVSVKLDKDLIGGVKVIVGDKVIDGSLKGRLESLKKVLV